jgi:hypothetical protein
LIGWIRDLTEEGIESNLGPDLSDLYDLVKQKSLDLQSWSKMDAFVDAVTVANSDAMVYTLEMSKAILKNPNEVHELGLSIDFVNILNEKINLLENPPEKKGNSSSFSSFGNLALFF